MDYHDCGVDGLTFTQPSLCHSEFAADCDLKTIIDRFMRLGQLPPDVGGVSADVTAMPDSFDSLQISIAKVRQDFEQLPPEVQLKYGSAEEWYLSTIQNDTPQDTPQDMPQDTPQDTPQDKSNEVADA